MSSISPAVTSTMENFGYPQTLIADYQWWSVLLRPKAVTLGSLILAAKAKVTAFSDLPPTAFAEMAQAVADIERSLKAFSQYRKINYLMLMMVDPEPHFHVIPRYQNPRGFNGENYPDAGWPGPPTLDKAAALSDSAIEEMTTRLKQIWGVS